jgi:hypothetical protein
LLGALSQALDVGEERFEIKRLSEKDRVIREEDLPVPDLLPLHGTDDDRGQGQGEISHQGPDPRNDSSSLVVVLLRRSLHLRD